MTKQYLDVLGLAVYGAGNNLSDIAAQAAPAAVHLPASDRLSTLAKLRNGAGVQVITGPLGREFWMVAGQEVQITVWPDDYDEQERWSPFLWAWVASGGDFEDGKIIESSHYNKDKTPTVRHRLYPQWQRVHSLLALYESYNDVEQEVVEDIPFRVLAEPEPLRDGVAIDFEWHRKTQEIVGMAVSDIEDQDDNAYTPTRASDIPDDAGNLGRDIQRQFSTAVRDGLRGVGHGLRADLAVVYDGDPAELVDGSHEYNLDDTMGMAYMLGELDLGLKPLSRKYLGRNPIVNDREWADMPARMTARYASAGDTRNTADLFKVFDKLLTGRQRQLYDEVERLLVPLIASMEKFGVPVDIEATKQAYRRFVAIQYGLARSIKDCYDGDLTTPEGQKDFIASFGFPRPESLDQRVLGLNQHWCIDLILEHNQARTRANNFLKKILVRWHDAGKPTEFRLYTRFNQFARDDETSKLAPGTGRLSSSGHKSPPKGGASGDNLQNQPRDIRDIYRAPVGHVWWSFDYDSLEIRIAAALSRDPEMLRSLEPGNPGLHTNFQLFIKDKTGRDVGRPAAKTGNFEQLYEGRAQQLVAILAKMRSFIDLTTAQLIVDSHHELFKVYHDWGASQVREARAKGYAETYEGRRRYLPDLYSDDSTIRQDAERAAQNHGVQGTAADVIKRAMLRVQPVLARYGGHMALQCHDELDGFVPDHVDLVSFMTEMKEAMECEIEGVKLLVTGGYGQRWSEAH